MDNTLFIEIRTPEQLLFSGNALSFSSKNEKGHFDVLPEHENFITTIKEKASIGLTNGQFQEFAIDTGIAHVYRDKVLVFLGVESLTNYT